MKPSIIYVTTSRSDYGPSYWVIRELLGDARIRAGLVVAGSHLSGAHGRTVAEIERDGFPILATVPFLLQSDDEQSFGEACAAAVAGFTKMLVQLRPTIAVVAGDRIELLPFITAAVLTRTAIAHLSGGDVTEGAIDEQVRHAVTKAAHLHFPNSALSANRVLQMGEEPWRVRMLGDPATDHFVRGRSSSVDELAEALGFRPDHNTLIVTFHPSTTEPDHIAGQTEELITALRAHDGAIVVTAPAPDPGAEAIRRRLIEFGASSDRVIFRENLGSKHYYGLLRIAGAMVGNSSSGLSEAPLVPLAVVNVGVRQQGRERGANVIDVPPVASAIEKAVRRALSPEFQRAMTAASKNVSREPVSRRIVDALVDLAHDTRLLSKRFVRLEMLSTQPFENGIGEGQVSKQEGESR